MTDEKIQILKSSTSQLLKSGQRHALSRFDPDVFPCEAAGQRRHGDKRQLQAALTDRRGWRSRDAHNGASDRTAPEDPRESADADGGPGELLMARRARP